MLRIGSVRPIVDNVFRIDPRRLCVATRRGPSPYRSFSEYLGNFRFWNYRHRQLPFRLMYLHMWNWIAIYIDKTHPKRL